MEAMTTNLSAHTGNRLKARTPARADCQSATRQIDNLRYEQLRQPARGAGWQPAVSRIDNPPSAARCRAHADCQSATRQIHNLRYDEPSRSRQLRLRVLHRVVPRLVLAVALAGATFGARAATEADLIGVLQSAAGAVEKCEACQQLRRVGTARAVPALAALLTDERVAQAARHALEGLAAPEATAALRDALARTSSLLKAGIVDSLGWRRDTQAVPSLKPLLADPDTTVATAAAVALGRIGSPDALAALQSVRAAAPPAVRPAVLEALLRCAEDLLATGKLSDARKIYESLTAPTEADQVHVAAHLGLLRCAGKNALAAVGAALQGQDAAAQIAALQVVRDIRDARATKVFAELVPGSPPALQVALLRLLQARGDTAALPAVLAAARSSETPVRAAALDALGELGDAGQVALLAEAATSADPAVQKAARQALATLHRGDVAGALVTQLNTATPAVQVEIIRALSARAETAAVPALLQLARSEQSAARRAAFRALGSLAEGRHAGALVRLLTDAKDEPARNEVVSVFESLAERLPDAQGLDTEPIVRSLASGDLETRTALLRVCALFVSDPLRDAFRAALKAGDARLRAAAARALCDARDPALLPDLLAVARETADASLRSSAIEGIVRLAGEEASGPAAARRIETLAATFELAARADDKRRVLSGLARVPSVASLKLAEQAAADPAVRAEAEAAALQIRKSLGFHGPFIEDWLVCGPFRKAGVVGALAVFDVPFGPENPGEPVAWRAVPRGEHVNLGALFPGAESCVAYLKAVLVAPADADAVLLLGSDDGVKAWLNGQVVHSNNVDRPDVADQDLAQIHLRKGTNTLMLKVTQGGGGWSARARIVGANGQPVAGLQVVPQAAAPVEVAHAAATSPAAPTLTPATLPPRDNYRKLRLTDQFYAEGAYFGDFNRDGKLDIVAGPFWFEGPDFTRRHEYRPVKAFDPKDYSDNFLTYAGDCNGDGWTDIVCLPWPGKEGYWYENPAGQPGHWKAHLYYNMVGNESPVWADVTGDGRPELVFNNEGWLGYAGPDPAQPTQPWVFHAVSTQDKRYQRYTHGVGCGDINGDGRADLVERVGWWGQPANPTAGQPWKFHPFHFADAAAQMLVYDVSGDGRADIITAWHCHEYGLVWWEQLPRQGQSPDWRQHVILPAQPDLTSPSLRVSQLHAFDLVDMNGDGLKDIVTGKRFWAHGPTGDKEPDAPAVVLWFELRREADGKVSFVPHLIDDDSGVGTQVATADLNGDGRPDVIVSNKKGIFVHLSQR